MSDEFETSEASERTMRVPPLFLLGGFLIVGTAGSAFFVLPSESPTTAVTSVLAIPAGEPVVGQSANPDGEHSGESVVDVVGPDETPVEPIDSETTRLSKLIVGDWQQDFYGKRTLTVKADGTAIMTILPSGVFAFGFGPKIDLTMFWSVKDGHLDYGVSGGTPADKVKLAAKTWGDHWVEKIVTLDDNKLDLLSEDGSSHSIWERANPNRSPEIESQSP